MAEPLTLKKKKKINKSHVTYNRKTFLAKDSIMSSAMIHTKIKKCGEAQVRISDCNQTIRLWNDMNDPKQVFEMLEKLDTLIVYLDNFRSEVAQKNDHVIR